jgi:glucokinase
VDTAADIAARAAAEPAGVAAEALRLFVALYGAVAGDIALVMMATGGVWIAGGIAPKIARWFDEGGFLNSFVAKGRMQPLVESMPVRLVLADDVALRGAARRAQRLE